MNRKKTKHPTMGMMTDEDRQKNRTQKNYWSGFFCFPSFYCARYFDPASGEFTSPDPLEYVDGMSLFRGYFVPNLLDPSGRLRAKENNRKTSGCADARWFEVKTEWVLDAGDPSKGDGEPPLGG